MRRRIFLVTLVSLALGIIITALFMAQMTWKQQGDCADLSEPLPASIRRVDCSGLAYGFPYKFVISEPRLDIGFLGEPNTSPTLLGVTATTTFDNSKLVLNVAFWSILSAAIISTVLYKLSSRQKKNSDKNKPEEKA